MWEFSAYVECPHCGDEEQQHFEVDEQSLGSNGGPSYLREIECFECDKKFWARGELRMEFEVDDVYSKKPRTKRRA